MCVWSGLSRPLFLYHSIHFSSFLRPSVQAGVMNQGTICFHSLDELYTCLHFFQQALPLRRTIQKCSTHSNPGLKPVRLQQPLTVSPTFLQMLVVLITAKNHKNLKMWILQAKEYSFRCTFVIKTMSTSLEISIKKDLSRMILFVSPQRSSSTYSR